METMQANRKIGSSDSGGLPQSGGRVCRQLRRALVAKRASLMRFHRPLRMLGYEWLLELCNLTHRSNLMPRGRAPFLDRGPTYGQQCDSGLLAECTRTRGGIACVREIREERPRLSLN